jgi:hypothetical protein
VNRQLLSVLASDAVTKKIRYRFIGVGNGKYTIEIVKNVVAGSNTRKARAMPAARWCVS